jgi:SulP family sulfate permease
MRTSVSKLFPFLSWLPLVRGQNLKADFIAGLTGAIIVLPQGVAFATIAGMPPEYGLYAGMIPAIIAALFGSSHHLVSGPTTAASVVMFTALSAILASGELVPGTEAYITAFVSLALTLTFMVGVIQLVMGIGRMGALVNFISHSVIIGFTAGAAILIASKQIKNFFGIDVPSGSDFIEILGFLATHLSEISPFVALVASITLIVGILTKRYIPRIPYMVVALLAGSTLAVVLNKLYGEGVTGIKMVGSLPDTLPPLSSPDFSLNTIKDLAPAAVAMTLFALTEAVSIARSLASRSGQHIDGNQEFVGQGLSNIFGSFFSGYVATGSFNRSGVNYEAGAKTPMAAVFAGLFLMLIVLFVAPWAKFLPNAAMAGILFMVAWGLIDFHHIKNIIASSKSETTVLSVTFFGALFLDLELAIFIGVMLSLALYLKKTATPKIRMRVPDPAQEKRKFTTNPALPECPQLKIVRIDGSLFFGAVAHVREKLAEIRTLNPNQKYMLLLAHGINFVDMPGAELLVGESQARRKIGGDMFFYRIKEGACDVIQKGGYARHLGEDHMFTSKSEAISQIFRILDKDVCSNCDKRIFNECKKLPES